MTDPAGDVTRLCARNLERGAVGHISCVALKHEGRWINIATALVLAPPVQPIGVSGCWRDDDLGFAVVRGVVDAQRVRHLLHGFAATRIMRGGDLPFPDAWGQDVVIERMDRSAYAYSDMHRVFREETDRMHLPPAGIVLRLEGGSTFNNTPHSHWEQISDRLPSWELAARDMAELGNLVGLGNALGPQTSLSVRIFSPVWVRLVGVELLREERVAIARVVASWPEDLDRCRITAIPPRESRTAPMRGGRTNARETTTPDDEGWHTALFRVPLPAMDGPWTMTLGLDGETIDKRDFAWPSPRLVAHELMDPGLELLRLRFTEGKSKAKDAKPNRHAFEEGSLWFLNVAGFAAMRYGDDVQNSVDLIAFLDDEHVAYVECTVEKPDGDKAAKTGGRAQTFANELHRQGGKIVHVTTAIFSVAARATVTEEQRKYAYEHDSVVIACKEDLARLLDLVRRGGRGEAVLNAISELGPPVWQTLGRVSSLLRGH